MTRAAVVSLALVGLLLACAPPPERQQPASTEPSAPSRPAFVNKVWAVNTSSSVAPGTLYVFLSEGTLLITSVHSKPALGTWKMESGRLKMVEESLAYDVEILELSDRRFLIRSHNPGQPVDIELVPAHE